MNAKKFFFILIATLVIASGLLGGVIYYGNSLIATKSQKIREIHADTDLIETRVSDTAKLAKKIATLSDVAAIADKFLPKDKDQISLLGEVFSIANSFGITLNNVSFNTSGKGPSSTSQTEELKEAPGVRVYPFYTGIDCVPYNTFISFLERLEINRRKAQIVSLDIKPIEKSTDNCNAGSVSVGNVKIEVYLKNEGQTTSTIPTIK